ncbi:MAG: mechanosensitive ion channel [Gemmatimonadales bacterium]
MREIFNTVLFTIGSNPITLASLTAGVAVLILTIWGSGKARRAIDRALTKRGGPPGTVGTVTGLAYYVILIAGFGISLSTVGIDPSALFAAGAIFAIGLGFAMQSIAQNFVAGVILVAERSITPGDILEVEGKIVKVQEMGIRASIVQTRDGEDLIIPNAVLIQTSVKNYTLRDNALRIRTSVGVVYRSDMSVVKRVLIDVTNRVSAKWSASERHAQVLLLDFGDNSVVWEAAVWIDDPWEYRPALSNLREEIWAAFQQQGIVIAFPQLDLHLDDEVAGPLKALANRVA